MMMTKSTPKKPPRVARPVPRGVARAMERMEQDAKNLLDAAKRCPNYPMAMDMHDRAQQIERCIAILREEFGVKP